MIEDLYGPIKRTENNGGPRFGLTQFIFLNFLNTIDYKIITTLI